MLAATPTLGSELAARGFKNVRLWPRGVDASLFRPRPDVALNLPRPIFLTVGRLAVEKNVEAFLKLDLPGTKLVVGDGPARNQLTKAYPARCFLAAAKAKRWPRSTPPPTCSCFRAAPTPSVWCCWKRWQAGVPVAGFPTAAPRDVIGEAPVGRLDGDLRRACLEALDLSRDDCRDFALGMTWQACAATFLEHVTEAAGFARAKSSPIAA